MTSLGKALGIPPEAAGAWVELACALDRLVDHGRVPECARCPDDWASDAPAPVRRDAVEACGHCPVLGPCAAYADAAGETCHVWGGRDRTPQPTKRGAAA